MLDPMANDEQISDSAGQDGSGLLMSGDGRTFAYDPHPLAELFPMIGGAEFAALVEDVRENGVRRPIVLFEGKVLDGRNRYMAAREVGCGYPVVEFTGPDPVAYVVSENLHRRHLSDTQRQMIGARIAKLPAHRPSDNTANGRSSVTTAEAAAMLNTAARGIERARSVVDNGTPALVAAVDAGEVSVSAASEVAKLPEAEQVAIVEQGPQAVRDTAKAARQKTAGTAKEDPREAAEPVDRERRELAKLTEDGLIDLIIGLRGDLAETTAKAKAAGAEVAKLKGLLALHTSDKDKAIAKLSRDLEHKSSEMFRANDNADVWARKAKKLTTEVEKLRKLLGNQLVPL